MSLHYKKLHLIHQILLLNDEALIDDLIILIKSTPPLQVATTIHFHFDLEVIKQKQGAINPSIKPSFTNSSKS